MGKRARQQRSEQKKAARDLGFSYEKLAGIVVPHRRAGQEGRQQSLRAALVGRASRIPPCARCVGRERQELRHRQVHVGGAGRGDTRVGGRIWWEPRNSGLPLQRKGADRTLRSTERLVHGRVRCHAAWLTCIRVTLDLLVLAEETDERGPRRLYLFTPRLEHLRHPRGKVGLRFVW